MVNDSPYGDVELRFLRRALGTRQVGIEEFVDFWLLTNPKNAQKALLAVSGTMGSGVSLEACCLALDIEPLKLYEELVRIEEKSERVR